MKKIDLLPVSFVFLALNLITPSLLSAERQDIEKVRQKTVLETIRQNLIRDLGLKDSTQTHSEKKLILPKSHPNKKLGLTGNDKIDKIILKNRLILQKRDGLGSKKILTGKEKIEALMKKNREKIKSMNRAKKAEPKDWLAQKKKETSKWQHEKRNQVTTWLKIKKALIQKWQIEKTKYKKNIPFYKNHALNSSQISHFENNLIEETLKKRNERPKIIKKETPPPTLLKKFVIKKAFTPPIKNQKFRPTCSSFATIRALEILLAQKGKESIQLSEQYFYWLSKPRCQKTPCVSKGSSAYYGTKASQKKSFPDIPLAIHCPYQEQHIQGNETQIPLETSCLKGHTKVKNFELLRDGNLAPIIKAFHNNYPIVAGMKLSSHYYSNNGHVFMRDLLKKGKRDLHAKGHAMLFVGYMKLPKKLHPTEGKICFLTANSWGTGWGVGGYSCLSQNWVLFHMKEQKTKFFLVLKDIESV